MKPSGFPTLLLVLFCLSAVPARSAEVAPAQERREISTAQEGDPGGWMARGNDAFRRGAFGEATTSYESALALYGQEANRGKECEALIALSQVSHFTGQYRKALANLDKALAIAKARNDRHAIAVVLGAIGNAHIGLGNYELALKNLREGLLIAAGSGYEDVTAAIQNNLGNLYSAQNDYTKARSAYRESVRMAEEAGNLPLAVSAGVNGAASAMREGKYVEAVSLLDAAAVRIPKTDDSYSKAYSLIGAGLAYSDLRRHLTDRAETLLRQAYAALREALAVAQRIDDPRTVSYAYGYLGTLYEGERRFPEALGLTRLAVFSAQQANSAEALYRWYWQSGRILARTGNMDEAIASYRRAILELTALRGELSSCYAAPESTYQKTASVVCSELVDLLLRRASRVKAGESAEAYLMEARETLEILKVYELREYFRDDCVDAARVVVRKLDTISEKTVVVYPILLPDRVEILASFSGRLKIVTVPVSVDAFTAEVLEYRRKLVKRTTWEFLPHAQKLYDWLIRPFEADLDAANADTLVFVPDGPLRTVPMAALHDGNRFLVNRYRIAVTPGLNLTDPHPVERERAMLLSMGLTQAVQGFPGLPYVSEELKSLRELYPGEELMNDQFRLENLENALKKKPYSIVHVASHGQFGNSVNDTFLLAFDERLTMDRLGEYVGLFKFREEPLDLLTLSACETAAGDNRAALGLAGVAVRAGARSALATLWHVNDPATYELVVEFYRQLRNPSVSRAAALQASQLKLLGDQRYDHPGYWAPFLLINNWL